MADAGDDQVPLLERVEMPSKLPKELQREMTLLQDEFADAQVEHSKTLCHRYISVLSTVYLVDANTLKCAWASTSCAPCTPNATS